MKELRDKIRDSLLTPSTWIRLFFMVLYGIICYVAIFVIGIVILFQFGVVLLTGKLNQQLLPVGQSISIYIYQILVYLTYNSEEKPFPFDNWPEVNEYQAVNLQKEPEPPQKEKQVEENGTI